MSSGQSRCRRWPPPMTRRPRLCSQPACSLTSMPMSTRARVPRGVSPSPQTFSRGNVVFSSSSDVEAGGGQPVGGAAAGRTGADDDHVGVCGGHGSSPGSEGNVWGVVSATTLVKVFTKYLRRRV